MPTHRMTTPIFSAEYWALKNPVLLKGERGLAEFYDEDGHVTRIREKVGDGVMGADRVITGTHWNDLPWIITGEKGDKGDTGPMPNHDWSGTDFIMMSCVTPLIMIEYLSATMSSHPQRRSRPVTAPYS